MKMIVISWQGAFPLGLQTFSSRLEVMILSLKMNCPEERWLPGVANIPITEAAIQKCS